MEIEVLARRLYDRHEATIRRLRGRSVIVGWGLLAEDERAPWIAVARLARLLLAGRRRRRSSARRART